MFRTSLVVVLLTLSLTGLAQDKPIFGFTAESSKSQRQLEAKLDSLTNRANLREWMRRMTAKPHHVGSSYQKENAEFALALFKSWGFDARIEAFDVLLPVPKTRVLSLTKPVTYEAKLWEPELKEDKTSGIRDELLPPYNAYSADGDVSAEVVYVNYGMPADYKVLESKGVSVKGRVVLARYGGGWRGLKPKLAAERGAVGCLIYSDPRDDGYFQGDVYPKGPYRNENGVQRGSIADMPIYPGDPLTPGRPSVPGVTRLSLNDPSNTLCKIPCQPISYGDALPILQNLAGPMAPEGWRGALPIPYHIGPGPATVRLKLEFEWKTVPCRNVIAVLNGSEKPDQWVIRGNHYDAWVMGAEDPVSGAVALLEEARCVGEMAKTGWRPRRTMIYCLWDGEEPGLLGSTEWCEKHAKELSEKAVSYLNTDSTGRGYLGMGGSHTLERMMNEAAREVKDPETGLSLFERARAKAMVDGNKEAKGWTDIPIGALGSGSDYTPFLQHLGIASMNLGMGGEDEGGVYHSTYDSFDHYTRFGDPEFKYGEALARVCGRIMLRFANADVVPSDPARAIRKAAGYLDEVMKLLDKMRADTDELNELLGSGLYEATFDPTKPNIKPGWEKPVPHLDFSKLQNQLDILRNIANSLDKVAGREADNPAENRTRWEKALLDFDRAMLDPRGLPGRPWFKHLIYAPGLHTGYGVKTLPGIREALEEKQWHSFPEQSAKLEAVLRKMAKVLSRAIGGGGIG